MPAWILVAGCAFNSFGSGDATATDSSPTTTTGVDVGPTTQSGDVTRGDPGASSLEGTTHASSEGTTADLCGGMPWWDDRWPLRRHLSVDSTGLAAMLTEVPVLVRLDDTRISSSTTQPGGEDLRFVSDDHTTLLAHEIERWNPTVASFVWVKIPAIPSEDAAPVGFWMYYGNDAATDAQDPASVWADGFVAVHHFANEIDSTLSGHDWFSDAPAVDTWGRIGRAALFDGMTHYLELPNEADFQLTPALSVEAWVRIEAFTQAWQAVVTKGDLTWRLHRNGDGNTLAFGTNTSTTDIDDLDAAAAVDDYQWHYAVATFDGSEKAIYIDGVEQARVAYGGPLNADPSPVLIGANALQDDRLFSGAIDEVRIADRSRSPEWISLQYRAALDQLLMFGEEESCM